MIYVIDMSKALVVFNSSSGNTKAIGEKIAEGLGCEVYHKKELPKDLSEYDLIVAGSWMAAGMLMGANMFKKIAKKYSGKVALFFTSGAPDEVNPMAKAEEGKPQKLIKEIMWEKMEAKLQKNPNIEIIEERYCCKGDIKFEKKKENYVRKHPSDQELEDAKTFGVGLKEKY
jgi:flavodoxin